MEDYSKYDAGDNELIQPSEPSFGPKPMEILELEEKAGAVITEQAYISFEHPQASRTSFVRDKNNNVISLKLHDLDIENLAFISEFSHLKQLSLVRPKTKNIDWLKNLHFIEEFLLWDSIISNYDPIGSLKHLKSLRLHGGKIMDFDFLENLATLNTLLIQDTKVERINFVGKLIYLEKLYLGNNQLQEITPVAYLHKLVLLAAWENYITDISCLRGLDKLRELYLQSNIIASIEPLLDLPNMSTCYLSFNKISNIPSALFSSNVERKLSVGQLYTSDNKIFRFEGNPLTSPPYSVIDLGMPAVHAYFENKEKYNARPLNEGRIIFVGDGSAGKSSLMDRILYNRFDKNKPQTDGIKIEQWHLQKNERDLKFNMWDFGGQEVQHAVHKFFFTSGCLYILVLDNRKEEEPEYWLQQIETLGGKAPVLVVFNKTDQNPTENVDRKFLKQKYPNIVGFYNLSCMTGAGLPEFQKILEEEAPKLSTVNDQFPGNWFEIKKELEASTTDEHHYLVYDAYVEICKKNGVTDEATQKLLLQYFSFIGTVTWFGDNNTYLEHMHVLNPAWITQGVYRIVTGTKTETLKGQINVSDFKELLYPIHKNDYVYNEGHYGYILALMKKFELCYTSNDKDLLIPSRFSKEPKIEYRDFIGEGVRTYILQFNDYLPVAVIHQFIVRTIERAFDRNYWYQGIVIQNKDNDTLAMVQLDKEAKRIYVRVKGAHVIGLWEYIREQLYSICKNYASLTYSEQVELNVNGAEGLVQYEDLLGHIRANRPVYFHPKLQKEFNVGYLMGLFEEKAVTLEKVKERKILFDARELVMGGEVPPTFLINILNNNSPTVNTQVNAQVNVEVNIQLVHQLVTGIKDDTHYLLEEIKDKNKALSDALQLALRFADEMSKVKSPEEAQGKGWGRRLKQVIGPIKFGLDFLKTIPEGYEAGHKILQSISELAHHLAISMQGV